MNAVRLKPNYSIHREGVDTADNADLSVLLTERGRSTVSAKNYETVHGFVSVGGTVSPTVTLQPIELVKWVDGNGAQQRKFVERGAAIGPLSDGDTFEFNTDGGGNYMLRVSALTGTNPVATVLIAGGKICNFYGI